MYMKEKISNIISVVFYIISFYWSLVFGINLFLQIDLILNKNYHCDFESILLIISVCLMTFIFFILFLSFFRKYIKKNTEKVFLVALVIGTFFLILLPTQWYYLGKEYILFSIYPRHYLVENYLIGFVTSPAFFYLLSVAKLIERKTGDGELK